jgi:SAM-dependent methyltransferase/uncharacterized protein YbaR (Trm112 family)
MRYSFLDLLACPCTHEPLVLVAIEEREAAIPAPYVDAATRVSLPGSVVGCLPDGFQPSSDLARKLASLASAPAAPVRNEQVVVWNALLVAPGSGRWYPVIEGIPEILPDSLRDWAKDEAFFEKVAASLPHEIAAPLLASAAAADRTAKPGDNFKSSEINLLQKVDNRADFLGPGLYSPFNPYTFGHSSDLIRGFSVCVPFLKLGQGGYVLDSGSGYSWTTEWFMKMGIRGVGVEINRDYLEVGRQRMGPNQPHLVVADAENLPFAAGTFDAVLGFDAFHHIPDRPAAMRQYARVLRERGRVVLVEPGGAHEAHEVSQAVMNKYGIREVGMELADVQGYIDGITSFEPAKETFLYPVSSADARSALPIDAASDRSFVGWCLYSIEKDASRHAALAAPLAVRVGEAGP